MPTSPPPHLSPRKRPRQARAAVTLDAIFEATIQVLVSDGPRRLTTTRVAERAGVSVGTMYQYFPHKQALFYALNERYLDIVADKVEATCRAQQGAEVAAMVEALVTTYWQAKTERAEVTRALYRSVVELDNEPLIVVDYAHTPDALESALAALRGVATARGGKLVAVFGCGGDRDRGKRPLMGEIATRLADRVVLTSDNPRSEDPLAILAEIRQAAGSAEVIADRAAAIRATIGQAHPADVILLAGKGHEPYQEIAGVRRPFSDLTEAQGALVARQEEGA